MSGLPEGNGAPEPPPDDRVIGRAFWRSMAVLGIAAAGVAAWRFWPAPSAPVQPVAPLPAGPAVHAAAEAPAGLTFTDMSARWGIDFDRVNGAAGERLLPETMGGGVAVWDVDADGDLDLLFADGDAWPGAPAGARRGCGMALFLGSGAAGGTPRFVRAQHTGLEQPWQGMGLALADLDGDDRPEILATGVGGVRLFAADHTPAGAPTHWREVTSEAGLSGIERWTTAAGFADLDRDGDLDLVVARYVEWSREIDLRVNYTLAGLGRAYGAPTGFAGTDLVFMEQSSPMQFADRTAERGLRVRNRGTGAPVAKALGLCMEDVDGDGDLDLFVANDTVQNFLFTNDGRGVFEERGIPAGVAFDRNGAATGAMGCDASHLRNDAAVAIAVGNFANEPCSLYVTPGDGHFADDAIVDGISAATRRALTFGVGFVDLDADGWEDLVLANGHVEDRISQVQPSQRYAQPAQVFRNRAGASGASFAEIPASMLGDLARPMVGRGLSWGDLDGDGAPDLVIGAVSGAPIVAHHAAPVGGHLEIALLDPEHPGNRQAIGALVTLRLSDGRTLSRTVMPTRSYLSQVPPVAWFGTGSAAATSIDVRWPDGTVTTRPAPQGTAARGSRAMIIKRTASQR